MERKNRLLFSRNVVGLKSKFLFASRCSSVNAQPKNPQPLGPNQAFLLTRVPSSRVSNNVFSGRMERPFET